MGTTHLWVDMCPMKKKCVFVGRKPPPIPLDSDVARLPPLEALALVQRRRRKMLGLQLVQLSYTGEFLFFEVYS